MPDYRSPILMNGSKITGVGNGTDEQDAVALGQLPSALDPLPITQGGTGVSEATAATLLLALGAAPLASPVLTGTPTAPTPAPLSGNMDIATTAYVDTAVAIAQSDAVYDISGGSPSSVYLASQILSGGGP